MTGSSSPPSIVENVDQLGFVRVASGGGSQVHSLLVQNGGQAPTVLVFTHLIFCVCGGSNVLLSWYRIVGKPDGMNVHSYMLRCSHTDLNR